MNNQFKTVSEYAQGQESTTAAVAKIAEFQNVGLPSAIIFTAGISIALIVFAAIVAIYIVRKNK